MSENFTSDTTRVFSSSDNFFNQLAVDIQNAHKSVCIQCMSFEADQVGHKIIELLAHKPNLDRTLLIDFYSKYVVNDVFLFSPQGLLNKRNALKERLALKPLLKKACEAGIKVLFTAPMGFLLHKYPARNHKKMILIDDSISYLGGLNFTEHNFDWADLMIRHTHPLFNEVLKDSFLNDISNKNTSPVMQVDEHNTLFFLDGHKTREAWDELLSIISKAKKVVAISPYISYPMLDAISRVPDNKVITPKNNNKPYVQLIHNLKRYKNINFLEAEGNMVHMKVLILDDETAIYGSANFDTISYLFEKEVVLKRTDRHLVEQLNTVAHDLIS